MPHSAWSALGLVESAPLTAELGASAKTLGPDRPISKPTTLTYQMKAAGSYLNDVNPTGPSIGDQLSSHNLLLQHNKQVGHLGANCTVTGGQAVCTAVLWLRGGQIVATGQLLLSVLTDGGTIHLAVSGGTGAFRHIGGQAKIQITGASAKIHSDPIPLPLSIATL